MLLEFISGPRPSAHPAGWLPLSVCVAGQLLRHAVSTLSEFHCSRTGILRFYEAVIAGNFSSCSEPSNTTNSSSIKPSPRCCLTCQEVEDRPGFFNGVLLTEDDVARVLGKLGLEWDDAEGIVEHKAEEDHASRCRDCRARGAAITLLEEKEAGEEELREAFAVFDANRDGYITPTELWMVLRRLEFLEGMLLEECRRMVQAFDEDGDGRISLSEFRSLLEAAR